MMNPRKIACEKAGFADNCVECRAECADQCGDNRERGDNVAEMTTQKILPIEFKRAGPTPKFALRSFLCRAFACLFLFINPGK